MPIGLSGRAFFQQRELAAGEKALWAFRGKWL